MAAAGIIPLSLAWIGDAVPYHERQATLSRLGAGTISGMMVGQLVGGLYADAAPGWRGAFLTLAAGYGVVAVLLARRVRTLGAPAPAAGSHASFAAQVKSVVRTPWARVVLVAVAAEGALMFGATSFLPAYLHARHGFTLSTAAALLALFAAGGFVYSIFARRIVQALGERRMVKTGGVLMGAGLLAWWLSPVGWLAGPIAFVAGFGTYLFHNTLQTHATQMVPASRGTAVAVFAFCLFTGQALGVSLGGYAFDHLPAAVLLLVPAAGLPLVAFWFARRLGRYHAASQGGPLT